MGAEINYVVGTVEAHQSGQISLDGDWEKLERNLKRRADVRKINKGRASRAEEAGWAKALKHKIDWCVSNTAPAQHRLGEEGGKGETWDREDRYESHHGLLCCGAGLYPISQGNNIICF